MTVLSDIAFDPAFVWTFAENTLEEAGVGKVVRFRRVFVRITLFSCESYTGEFEVPFSSGSAANYGAV